VAPEPARRALEAQFSLSPCGPFDGLLARLGLMRAGAPRLLVRAGLAALITWVPLLLLSLLTARRGEPPAITFFNDVATHVRFLIVGPLLVLAEGAIGTRTRMVAAHFLESGLVGEADGERFLAAGRRTRRLLNSKVAELILLGLAIVAAVLAVRYVTSDGSVFWYEQAGTGGEQLTAAGWWYASASPIVGFLFLRWGWRYLVWCLFLARMARLDLHVATSHPDRTGGLGFVNIGHTAFAKVAMAASCIVCSVAANDILYQGVQLTTLRTALIIIIVVSVLVGIAPLLVFARPLAAAQRRALLDYSRLSVRYIQGFERKWLGGNRTPDEDLLGSGDIQSLADLGGGYERLNNMRIAPIEKRTFVSFAVMAALPMVPLALMVMPIRDLVKLLMKSVL
jgi:hypothetical protein